jgi:hypothetical protein
MLKLKCPAHPRYTAKKFPASECEVCLELFYIRTEALTGLVKPTVVECSPKVNKGKK